jgi:spermidine/putrescine transport system permease protein/putrescine transport system permease protein
VPEPLRKAGSFLGALCLVVGLIAVVAFLVALAGGRGVGARGRRGRARSAAIVVVPRLVALPRLLGGFSALVYAFLFFPIVVVVIYAFNSGTNVAEFAGFSTRPFSRALDDESITSSITRSLQIAVASATIATIFGTAAALALSKVSRRVRNPFDVLVFLTLVVPELVIAISSLIFFVNVGFELGLVRCSWRTPSSTHRSCCSSVRARFVSMGSSLEEASMDLGASALATFRQVTLPRLAPAIVAGAILSFTFSFDDVVISNFTAGAGNDTWPLRILSGLRFGLSPDLNAAATMMLAVTLLGLGGAALILRRAARTQGSAGLSLSREALAVPERRTAIAYDERCLAHVNPPGGVALGTLPSWATVEAFERPSG